ncbi:type IX secretion system protein PorG [Mucilaginibacter polytrichastri]|uniref:DUF6089 domain-containing protein n=1 Tax=Mucilaginibacter polytrichastri TaxID=1302689 RepID=A0A1Q5ZU45_9SPHI|nr:DUF6089 family protein [Mucilaginibacter polytrichastri]OKS85253.1 hypothetical protein RG47T_0697 [Mucilaginibacter polytrichastri]SFS41963.1 Outer membrane protein beta-barrel domain-containing protein [Mucilaginibacter polytrichastri]
MRKIFTLLLLSIITLVARAQTWEAGGIIGGAGYMGDLNSRNPVQVSGGAIGVFARKNYSPYFSVRGSYTFGWISADDKNSPNEVDRNRNLSFLTTLHEVSARAEFNFLEYRPGVFNNSLTPYVFLGLGGVYYSPTAKADDGQRYDLRSGRTEGETKPYSKIALSIPYGVGLKYNFLGKLSLTADATYHYTNTDYLDDVSGNYADPSKFTNATAAGLADRRLVKNPLNPVGTQRGDLRPHDSYMFFSISISYTWITDRCYFTK